LLATPFIDGDTGNVEGQRFPAQLAPLLGSFGIGGASAKPVPPAPPPPRNGGTVRIYGLDDGTKEFAAPK
jgi:hypothetical protein